MEELILKELQKLINKPFKINDIKKFISSKLDFLCKPNIIDSISEEIYNPLMATLFHFYNKFDWALNNTIISEISTIKIYNYYKNLYNGRTIRFN